MVAVNSDNYCQGADRWEQGAQNDICQTVHGLAEVATAFGKSEVSEPAMAKKHPCALV